MKLCYVDESGHKGPNDPVVVMVGILADAARAHRTKAEFAKIFGKVQAITGTHLKELKGSKIINGRDSWRNIAPDQRKGLVADFCDWLAERKHLLVVSAMDQAKFNAANDPGIPKKDIWLAAALHVALQVQKLHQGIPNNKGHTFLIFDENKAGADALSELLWDPPSWTDDYYGRGKKQDALDQLVDSAFTVKSHHAGLVQVADLFAYIFRRHCELNDFGLAEEWAGERELIAGYIAKLKPRLTSKAARWPTRSPSPSAQWFNAVAPDCLKAL